MINFISPYIEHTKKLTKKQNFDVYYKLYKVKKIKELKKYSVRREITKTANNIVESMKGVSTDTSYLNIIENID